MGRGDIKSRKGKISNGSYGNKRKRADNAVKFSLATKPVAVKTEEKK